MERDGSAETLEDSSDSQLIRLMGGGALGWKAMLLFGVVTLVLGVIVAFHPTTSLSVIAVLLGILLIASGIYHLVQAFDRAREDRVWTGIIGLLLIVSGVVLIRHLDLSIALLGLIVGFTWIAQGVAALLGGFTGALGRSSGWSVFFGVISVIAGIVVVSAPITSVTAIAILLGVWFAVMGALEIIGAFVVRRMVHQAERMEATGPGHARDIPGQRAADEARSDATSADRPSAR
jgi:uncharacterized membrane protein HdeD (DUF308 family)